MGVPSNAAALMALTRATIVTHNTDQWSTPSPSQHHPHPAHEPQVSLVIWMMPVPSQIGQQTTIPVYPKASTTVSASEAIRSDSFLRPWTLSLAASLMTHTLD